MCVYERRRGREETRGESHPFMLWGSTASSTASRRVESVQRERTSSFSSQGGNAEAMPSTKRREAVSSAELGRHATKELSKQEESGREETRLRIHSTET